MGKTIFIVFVGIGGLVYCAYFGYWSWFKPEKLTEKLHKYRERIKYQNLVPQFINEIVLDLEKTLFYLWWVRIGMLIGIVLFSFLLFAYFFGPF